jgi:hypothetical protein
MKHEIEAGFLAINKLCEENNFLVAYIASEDLNLEGIEFYGVYPLNEPASYMDFYNAGGMCDIVCRLKTKNVINIEEVAPDEYLITMENTKITIKSC